VKRVTLALLLAACAPGRSALTVTVTSDGMIGGIDHFDVTVTEKVSPPLAVGPIQIKLSDGNSIPPDQEFVLAFDADVSATVSVAVIAADASDAPLSSGAGEVAIAPSKSAQLTVTLPGAGSGEMGANADGGNDLSGAIGDGGDASAIDLLPAPDLLPPPGCPSNPDALGPQEGDPCSGAMSLSCYSGAFGTCGVGACRAGMMHCLDGAWGPCVGEVDPQPEVCDGRDQDCNGAADDGLPMIRCGVGECVRTVAACTAGKPTVCTPKNGVAETCDGKDNDCNGAIDELGCSCIHVTPTGDDSMGDGSAAKPLRTIGKGISVASALGTSPKIVCVASGTSCPSTFRYNEKVVMVDGVHVYGGYESTNWTRSLWSCAAQIWPSTGPSVSFDVNILDTTILDGFQVADNVGVVVQGSKGAILSNNDFFDQCFSPYGCWQVQVVDYFGVPATPLITHNRFRDIAYGIVSSKSAPVIIENCDTRDVSGHCVTSSCNGTRGFFNREPAITLNYSPGAVVAENEMCAQLAISGDAGGTLVRANTITDTTGDTAAVLASTCNGSPWLLDNLKISSSLLGGTGSSVGVVAYACDLRIDHNLSITGESGTASTDSVGVWCQRNTSSLRESRCQIVDNVISGGSSAGVVSGVRCDDVSCARIEGNQITGGPGMSSYGLRLSRSGTLVARNVISSGCMSGSSGVSVAIDASDSFARVENNLIEGGACGGNVFGVRVHALNDGEEIDLHSNDILAGGVAAGCTGRALSFDFGATMPASPRGMVRNNILLPGACSSAGYDLAELAAGATPRVIENNDFAPPGSLYHNFAGMDLTKDQINMLAGASANISADPMLDTDGIHLKTGSMCIGAGTSDGAPPDDYFGAPRPKSGIDIGMDQF
jgi:hypothetical protein